MTNKNDFDVVVIGGSYSGLAAGMALGRALKKVMIIDDGKPCNIQTPNSHNFLTNDGKTPAEISHAAKKQVQQYETIHFLDGRAAAGIPIENGFEVRVSSGEIFGAKKLIFATGIRDILPPIDGLSACWGISVIHCPFCHGYEVLHETTGILGNGEQGYDFTRLISNWTKKLTLFTNGATTLTPEQATALGKHNINLVEKTIQRLVHHDGHLEKIVFTDGSSFPLSALYAPAPFEQHCDIPQSLGCALTGEGYIKVDGFQETTVQGIYACGDNTAKMRTVATAVAMGTTAGMSASKKMIVEAF